MRRFSETGKQRSARKSKNPESRSETRKAGEVTLPGPYGYQLFASRYSLFAIRLVAGLVDQLVLADSRDAAGAQTR